MTRKQQTKNRGKRGRVRWTWLLAPVAVPFALAVGLVAGGVLFLATESGKRIVAEQVLRVANGSLAGRVDVNDVTVDWLSFLELDGVSVTSPLGEPVFRARRILVRYRPAALLSHEARVELLRIEFPEVVVAYDAEGVSNIDRLLGPSTEEPQAEPELEPWDGTLPVDVTVSRIQIVGGVFRMTDAGAESPVVAEATRLNLEGGYRARGAVHTIRLDPLEADIGEPELGLFSVELTGVYDLTRGQDEVRVPSFRIEAPGLSGRATAEFVGFDLPVGRVELAFDRLGPEFLKRLDPELPVIGDLGFALALQVDTEHEGKLESTFRLPTGRIDLEGRLGLADIMTDPESLSYDLDLTASDLRIDSALDLGLPPLNPLDFRLAVKGRGVSPAQMDTRFTMDVSPIVYQGYRFHGGRLSGVVERGTVVIEESQIESPYATLDVDGFIALDGPIRVSARLKTDDLGRLGRQIDLPLSGDLDVRAQVAGSLDAPLVDFEMASSGLVYGEGEEVLARLGPVTGGGTVRTELQDGETQVSAVVTLSGSGAGFPDPMLRTYELTGRYGGEGVAVSLNAQDVYGHPVEVSARMGLEDQSEVVVDALALPLGEHPWILEAPFVVRLIGDDVEVSSFQLAGPDGSLSGQVSYHPEGNSRILMAGAGILLDNMAPFTGDAAPHLRGRLRFKADVRGSVADPQVALLLGVDGFAMTGVPELSVRLAVSSWQGATPRIGSTVTVELAGGGKLVGRVDLPASLTLEGDFEMAEAEPLSAEFDLVDLDLEPLGRLDEDPVDVSGKVKAHLVASGTLEAPFVEVTLNAENLATTGVAPLDARARARFDQGRLRSDAVVTRPSAGPVPLLAAWVDLPLTVTADLDVAPAWEGAVQGKVAVPAQKVAQFAALDPELERVRGDVMAELILGGRLGDPSIRLNVRGRSIRPAGQSPFHFDLEGTYAAGKAALVTRFQLADTRPGHFLATLDVPLSEILRGGDISMRNLVAQVEVPELDFMQLPPIVRGPQVTGGTMRLSGWLRCAENTPEFVAHAAVLGLASGDTPHDIVLDLAYQRDLLSLRAEALGEGGTGARVEGDIPLVIRIPLATDDSTVAYPTGLQVEADLTDLNLDLLNAFMPAGMTLRGSLDGHVSFSGSLEAPEARGSLRMADGLFYSPTYGTLYRDIQGRVRMTPSLFAFHNLSMSAGKGTLTAGGAIALVDSEPGDMDIDLHASRFEVMNGPYGRMSLEGDIHVGGTVDAPDITGEITIPGAVVKLPDITSTLVMQLSGLEKTKELAPVELPSTIHVLTRDGVVDWNTYETGEVEEEVPFDMNADVTVHIPRGFWVQNESQEVVVELEGDVRYVMERGVERMEGEVRTVRGEINLFSQPLVVKTGTITFTGGQEIDPILEIINEADTPDYGLVTLKVTGRSSAPVVTFGSDRGYDPADILAILVIGKPLSESNDPSDSARVASQVESLAAGVLAGIARKQLADKIPIDYLEIKAESFSSADLRVGKYITPKLFVSYKRKLSMENTGEENVNEVRAEYQLSRNLYLESFYGDAGIWGGDINWRKNY